MVDVEGRRPSGAAMSIARVSTLLLLRGCVGASATTYSDEQCVAFTKYVPPPDQDPIIARRDHHQPLVGLYRALRSQGIEGSQS